jgi:hypothetical protein
LKDELEKKNQLKKHEWTRDNLLNSRFGLWDQDNFIKNKLKKLHNPIQLDPILNVKIEKKIKL